MALVFRIYPAEIHEKPNYKLPGIYCIYVIFDLFLKYNALQ